MVTLVKHDLEFILKQIKISELHAKGGNLAQLVGNPLLPYGLRTVDGSDNNLIPGREEYGAADRPMPQLMSPEHRTAERGTSYAQPGNGMVVDSQPRTISNLIADQTLANPAFGPQRVEYTDAFDHDGDPNTPDAVFIENKAPDDGISAPFNSWMTLFGQFFDHGLDLIHKGGNGFVYMPLKPDDELYVEGSSTNFMILTRATNHEGTNMQVNKTTGWIDQNQTYTSNSSHQVFLREYELVGGNEQDIGKPVATGRLLEGVKGGNPTWAEVKAQAREKLGINLTDANATNVPLLATDEYGNFIPGPNGFPMIVTGPTPQDLVEGNPGDPIPTTNALPTGHAFLDDIAHSATPVNSTGGQLQPDDDTSIGLTPAEGGAALRQRVAGRAFHHGRWARK